MTLIVYLAGEGVTDIGGLAYEPPYRTNEEGFLQPVVRRSANQPIAFRGGTMVRLAREPIKTVSEALAKKAAAAAALAEREGADVLIFAHDVDKPGSKKNTSNQAERAMTAMRAEIEQGLAAARPAAEPVIATPLRTIEAWMLGDPRAVAQWFGLRRTPALSKDPEKLWGKPNDPESNHPKCCLNRIVGQELAFTDYAAVAERADLDTIRTACPKSFLPFHDDLLDAVS